MNQSAEKSPFGNRFFLHFMYELLFWQARNDINKEPARSILHHLKSTSQGVSIYLQNAVVPSCGDLTLALVSAKHEFSGVCRAVAAIDSLYRQYDERFDAFEGKVAEAYADDEMFFTQHTCTEALTEAERLYLNDLIVAFDTFRLPLPAKMEHIGGR